MKYSITPSDKGNRITFIAENYLDRLLCSTLISLKLADYTPDGDAVACLGVKHSVEYSIAHLQSQAFAKINYKQFLKETTYATT